MILNPRLQGDDVNCTILQADGPKISFGNMWVQTADIENSEVRILEQFLAIQAFMDTRKSVLLLVEIDINGSGTRYQTLAVHGSLSSESMFVCFEIDVG